MGIAPETSFFVRQRELRRDAALFLERRAREGQPSAAVRVVAERHEAVDVLRVGVEPPTSSAPIVTCIVRSAGWANVWPTLASTIPPSTLGP
jgi:hypothetical protein